MAQGDKTVFSKEVEIFSNQVQEIENAINDIYSLRNVDAAFGATLDYIGEIVGVSRPVGVNDIDYRLAIKAQIQLNSSGGEPERLIFAIKLLTGATSGTYTEPGDGKIFIYVNTIVSDSINAYMQRLRSAGVQLFINADPFLFDSSTNGLDNGHLL